MIFDPDQTIKVDVSLQTTTFGPDQDPIEAGFTVSVDISCHHPKFAEVLKFFGDHQHVSLADCQHLLSLLQ